MSEFGAERLLKELQALGHNVTKIALADGNIFLVFPSFTVPAGRFIDRVIDLGLQATPDFPNSVAAAIHVKASPQLIEPCNIPNLRNVHASVLGPEWLYWSKNFNWHVETEKTARRYLAKITTIFEHA